MQHHTAERRDNEESTKMNEPMVDVYRCADRVEAETIRIRLAAAGISAFLHGDDAVTSMSISGGGFNAGIVIVQVASADYQRATETLEEDRARSASLGAWTCDDCSENNEPTFDLCWNCGNAREANVSSLPEQDPLTVARRDSQVRTVDSNPYRPTVIDEAMDEPTAPAKGPFGPVLYWAFGAAILVALAILFDALK